jgi:hypothetical protein
VAELAAYLVPDPHCPDAEGYPIYSVYADSPAHTFFWEKVEGIKYRRKLRFRRYGESPEAWLEIKQRIDRTLQKRRVRWPVERVEETFFQGHPGERAEEEARDRVESEVFFLWRHYGLRPTMGISYRRRAFFATAGSDLRLTFDHRVQYHPADPDLRRPDAGRALVPPELAILEIKYDHAVPLWLCAAVQRFELKMIRLSKYCSAVDRAHYGAQLT